MARLARVVAPGIPHHVTQRGNRRQQTFFEPEDYQAYISLMAQWCTKFGVEVWAYCLMTNHVHLIVVPDSETGLKKAIAETHQRFTRRINFQKGWRGHLWQGRFASFPLDEAYLLSTARYVELNPVRANRVPHPEDYPWSSAKAHFAGEDDELVKVSPLLDRVSDWRSFLSQRCEESAIMQLRQHERTGRPLGDEDFLVGLEKSLGRTLRRKKPGPKSKSREAQCGHWFSSDSTINN